MGIVNRSMDASEQRVSLNLPLPVTTGTSLGVMVSGSTGVLWIAPYPCVIEAARCVGMGVSTAAKIGIWKNTAATWNHTGISMIAAQVGVSGPAAAAGFTTGAGATLQQFATGDIMTVDCPVSNSAVWNGVIAITVKKLQDIVTHLGV